MRSLLRPLFRKVYYGLYGGEGKQVMINNEPHRVSAYIARGIATTIDEKPYNILKQLCRDAGQVLDVGASMGMISLLLAKQMKQGSTIYSFEPTPAAFKILKDNARVQNGNARIVPYNMAMGNSNSVLYFKLEGDSTTNRVVDRAGEGVVQVQSTTIDAFCAEHHIVPEVIKIDVEGWEYNVLQGMQQVLRSDCKILIEVHQPLLIKNGVTREAFNAIIKDAGYYVYDTSGNNVNSPFDVDWVIVLSKQPLPASIFAGNS